LATNVTACQISDNFRGDYNKLDDYKQESVAPRKNHALNAWEEGDSLTRGEFGTGYVGTTLQE